MCPKETQINLYIHPFWFSFFPLWIAWRLKTAHAISEDSDQIARMRSLIWVFAGRMSCCSFVVRCLVNIKKKLYQCPLAMLFVDITFILACLLQQNEWKIPPYNEQGRIKIYSIVNSQCNMNKEGKATYNTLHKMSRNPQKGTFGHVPQRKVKPV